MSKKSKFNPFARRYARELTLKGLYAHQLGEAQISLIEAFLMQQPFYEKSDKAYFKELFYRVVEEQTALDNLITPHLDRSMDELDPIELNILRLGTYELAFREEIPHKVIINEALELAKLYGAQDGHKYVNGILDKVAQQVRSA